MDIFRLGKAERDGRGGGGDVGQVNAQSAVRRLRLDDVELTYVVDGSMTMYREQFFPAVPQSYWDDHPDELTSNGRVAMSAGGLLVRRDAHTLLIDVGYGPVIATTPFGQVDSGALLEVLTALELEPTDIDVVAFTHLHVDHTGWAFGRESGVLAPTFPRASYRVSGPELGPYRNGEHPVGSPSVTEMVQPLLARSQPVADGEEVAPGVTAMLTPGHSAGYTSYLVTTVTGRRVVVFGDVFHIPAQSAHPRWPSRPMWTWPGWPTHGNESPPSWSNRPPLVSGSISATSPLAKSCATRKVWLDGGL